MFGCDSCCLPCWCPGLVSGNRPAGGVRCPCMARHGGEIVIECSVRCLWLSAGTAGITTSCSPTLCLSHAASSVCPATAVNE